MQLWARKEDKQQPSLIALNLEQRRELRSTEKNLNFKVHYDAQLLLKSQNDFFRGSEEWQMVEMFLWMHF